MDTYEIVLRLGTATVVGIVLNRDLRGKAAGVRTLGLVGLASALMVMGIGRDSADASRVVQGIVTGIGFPGAGVIVRESWKSRVHGLTTAACVWLTAGIGSICALGEWRILLASLPLAFIILVFGGAFEKMIHRHWPEPDQPDPSDVQD